MRKTSVSLEFTSLVIFSIIFACGDTPKSLADKSVGKAKDHEVVFAVCNQCLNFRFPIGRDIYANVRDNDENSTNSNSTSTSDKPPTTTLSEKFLKLPFSKNQTSSTKPKTEKIPKHKIFPSSNSTNTSDNPPTSTLSEKFLKLPFSKNLSSSTHPKTETISKHKIFPSNRSIAATSLRDPDKRKVVELKKERDQKLNRGSNDSKDKNTLPDKFGRLGYVVAGCNNCLNFEFPIGRDIRANLTKGTIEEIKKVPKKE